MPGRQGAASCWSCGLDPSWPPDPDDDEALGGAHPGGQRKARPALLVGGGLLVALVAMVGSLTLLAPAHGDGVRGLAARLRGDSWMHTEVLNASAEFPVPPVRRPRPAGQGMAGELLVARTSNLRAELLVTDVAAAERLLDASAVAERLVVGYAATASGRIVQRAPVTVGRLPGLDAILDTGGGQVQLRSIVAGTTGYLMAVEGSPRERERFLRSFELEGMTTPPGR